MKNRRDGNDKPSRSHIHSHVAPGDSGVSRREFLGTLGALGVAAALPVALPTSLAAAALFAQSAYSAKPALGRIDVHHHLYPPFYVKAMAEEMAKTGFHAPNWTRKLRSR